MNVFYKRLEQQPIQDKNIIVCSEDTLYAFRQLWMSGILEKHDILYMLQKSYNRIYGLCQHNNVVSYIIIQLCIIDYLSKSYCIRLPEKWAWIYQTYTFPQYRNHGYATYLKNMAENIVYCNGIRYIGTEVAFKSNTMLHVNAKLGYTHLEQIQTLSDFRQWIQQGCHVKEK